MPAPAPSLTPPWGILPQIDVRAFGGVSLFDRGAGAVSWSAAAVSGSAGVMEDARFMLHGQGSTPGRGVSADAQSQYLVLGHAGVITITLNADDRFVITSDVDIAINAGTSGALGFVGGQASTGAGPYVITAAQDWPRGRPVNGVLIDMLAAPFGQIDLPGVRVHIEDSIVWLRERGTPADLDDTVGTLSLEELDIGVNDPVSKRIRWRLDPTGRVEWSAPNGLGVAAPTWLSTEFRDLLGFTGQEALNLGVGGVDYQTATHPLPGSLFPSRRYRRLRRTTDERTATSRAISGRVSSNRIARFSGWDLEAWVDGPVVNDLAYGDLEEQYTERFLNALRVGTPCNLYRHFGDPRRYLPAADAVGGTGQAAYDQLYSTEFRRGRLRLVRSPDDETGRTHDYEGSLDQRHVLTMKFTDNVAG